MQSLIYTKKQTGSGVKLDDADVAVMGSRRGDCVERGFECDAGFGRVFGAHASSGILRQERRDSSAVFRLWACECELDLTPCAERDVHETVQRFERPVA